MRPEFAAARVAAYRRGSNGLLTYHGVPAAVWAAQQSAAQYLPEGFADEGFIHTSPDPQSLSAALNRHHATDTRPYLALLIDLELVTAPWQISRQPQLGVDFPHIHGALNRDAVTAVVPVPRSASGAFLPPQANGA